ncbi:NAD-dependent protein deacylase [candidate division KSB3 bacterium]|uniref:protein acetyllysine N-acetyltransferase n=1 Tax=candidate division KSB3 bacterium TaxID=2044937 RepID=A0A9D5Q6C2_9BACT|nr:NAD-dependent protein deacylase [candidate division KSB3 bacterium]MBD3325694.1 NAD-dependent protein deacylase [candidate division KSB3 bacterium]
MNDNLMRIAQKIAEGGRNLVFTGAGISTESGIPDYRSQGGIWQKFRPVYFDEFMASQDARIEYWRRKAKLYHGVVTAKPNPAHTALVALFEMGLLEAVITQNIDNLHQKAGLPADRVIELHGNTLRVRCMSCGQITSIHEAQQRIEAGDLAPECACGGYLKPDTISFGQAMPVEQVSQAVELARTCNFLMVVGSTLVVHPAASIPDYARQQGAFLAIVNLSETPYDGVCDILIRGKAGEILPQIVEHVRTITKS